MRRESWRYRLAATAEPAAHLPRVDPASQAARERYWAQVMTELAAIDKSQLSGEDPVNYEVFRQ
ncbi:DUF885 domain-containing protein, partial [Lysobacter sp. 2RAB21]